MWYSKFRMAVIVLLVLGIISMGSGSASELGKRYMYISTISCDISINGNTISYMGVGSGSESDTDTVVIVRLQRKSTTGTRWATIESYSDTAHGGAFAGYSGTARAERGFEYRVYVLCTIYDENDVVLESKSSTSPNTVSY